MLFGNSINKYAYLKFDSYCSIGTILRNGALIAKKTPRWLTIVVLIMFPQNNRNYDEKVWPALNINTVNNGLLMLFSNCYIFSITFAYSIGKWILFVGNTSPLYC